MRSFRILLLVALVALAGTIYGIFNKQRVVQRAQRPNPPAPMPLDTKASALDYEWGQSDSGRPRVKIAARSFKQGTVGDKVQLEGLQLQIFNKEGTAYDLIKSPNAEFDQNEGKLYSPGECDITLNVPFEGKPKKALTTIKTSGVNFDSKSGFALTDRNTAFSFEGGEGVSTGASYDPEHHELKLMKDVVLNLRGKGPKARKMKVESGELVYSEAAQMVTFAPWTRMTRDQLVIDSAVSSIKIREKAIDWIDAINARGIDKEPKKQLEYAGDLVHVRYNDDGEMEKLEATGNAKLISHAVASNTTVTGNRVDLFFTMNSKGESELSSAAVNGNGRVESIPIDDPKGKTADTKIIAAEVMDLHMKPGGKELDRVQTHAPGALEFLPHQATRHRRVVKGFRMTINYAAKNEVQAFHSANSETETYPTEEEKKRKKPVTTVSYTSSKGLDAAFDEKGQLKEIRQQENFKYVEGDRKAQADFAIFDNAKNTMLLDKNARMADATGSTSADKINLQQTTGDFQAIGHAATTRIPERPDKSGKKKSSSMLDDDEPMQGTADTVESADRNKRVRYLGNAVVWQTSNRITANAIDIDRGKKQLVADGQVVTQFIDTEKIPLPDPKASPKSPVAPKTTVTIVRSQHMVYTDADRLAAYTGQVTFARPTMTVKSESLQAFLNENGSDEDSRINKAFSDGKVVIMETSLQRQRVGSSEHAEYYTEDGKIILSGGTPRLDDPKKGNTEGQKLTYYTDDERLEVDGTKQAPVKSLLRRRKS